MRLGGKVADGDVHSQVDGTLPAGALEPSNGVGNAQHILVRLAWQANHEVQLDLYTLQKVKAGASVSMSYTNKAVYQVFL